MAQLTLPARPEPLAIDLTRTALVVNDMQNAFCSRGGYIDRIGFDLSGAQAVIGRIGQLVSATREAGVANVFLQNGFSSDLHEAPRAKRTALAQIERAALHARPSGRTWSYPGPRQLGP